MENPVITPEQLVALEAAIKSAPNPIGIEPQVLVRLVYERIATREGGAKPTILQVIEVIKTAVTMGLDPTGRDVFAFLNREGVLTVGVSKGGWEKAIELKSGSIDFVLADLKQVGNKTILPWVQCIITRKDGSKVKGIPAFYDECAQPTKSGKDPWSLRPKHMLCVRALTNAAKAAYGFGAYTIDEAKEVFNQQDEHTPRIEAPAIKPAAPKALPAPTQDEILQGINQLKECKSIDEMRKVYISLAPNLRTSKEVVEASKELAHRFENNEQPEQQSE